MPTRRVLNEIPDSRKRNQELRTIARTAGQVAGFMRDANPKVRAAAKILNRYIPKGKSSLERKLGTTRSTLSRGTQSQTKKEASESVAEGQSLKITKPVRLNLGGKGQISKIPKLLEPLWVKYMWQYISATRSLGTTLLGANVIHTTDNLSLPIHCYDLTFLSSMSNSSDAGFAGRLNQDGRWTIFEQNPVLKDADSGSAQNDSMRRCTKWLHQNVKIKLLLYGRQKQSTQYKIMFFRVDDEENAPLRSDPHFDRDEIQRHIWWKHVAPFTTNPVYIGHNAPDFRGPKGSTNIKILKQFNYTISEQLSTEDIVRKLNVNFNIDLNKIKIHNESNTDVVFDADITANVPTGNNVSNENSTKTCHANQRVYMAIIASSYEIPNELNFESPSYDINMQQVARASLTHGWPL